MINDARGLVLTGLATGAASGGAVAAGIPFGLATTQFVWLAFVMGAVIGALGHNLRSAFTYTLDNRTQTLRNRLERLQRNVGDIHGMIRLQPYSEKLPLPFGGGWALTGDSAAVLAREVIVRKPQTILELGSGVSTLVVGQILANQGSGRLISIDHDSAWAEKTRQNVAILGLEAMVTVIHAPLGRLELNGCSFEWYGIEPDVLSSLDDIDLLIVDGPPQLVANTGAARYPAFPMLREKLSSKAIVFVDDAARAAEASMVSQWLENWPDWTAESVSTVDGVVILSRRAEESPTSSPTVVPLALCD